MGGRPPRLDTAKRALAIRLYQEKNHTIKEICQIMGISKSTLYIPVAGLREMCSWEQFCRFARCPERRKVGTDARITIEGTAYEV